jgi:trimeric autotransporter adhesin
MKFRGLILSLACVSTFALAQTPAAPNVAPTAAQASVPAGDAAPVRFEITGTVKSGATPLPGVTVVAAHSLTGKKVTTSTDVDGSFQLVVPNKGKWVVRAEMSAFAVQTAEVRLDPTAPTQKIDLTMTLLSRVPKTTDGTQMAGAAAALGNILSGNGTERLTLNTDVAALASLASGGNNGSDAPLAGANAMASSADATNESVAVSGQMGNSQDLGLRNMDELRDRIQELRAQGRLGDGGGPGGPGGFGDGGPMIFRIPGGGRGGMRGFNINRPHGALYYSAGNGALDASPFPLSGMQNSKPDYGSNRFGGMVGGPLNIPHIYNGGTKTFFFGGYTGVRNGQPYDVFSHVPTALERVGDFSQTLYTSGPNAGQPVQLFDPTTGAPLGSNIASMISPQAQALLKYIPLPNQPGEQNYRFTSTQQTSSDSANIRLTHNFGSSSGPGGRGGGPIMIGGPGGGGRGGGRPHNNINIGANFMRSNSDLLRPFAGLGGSATIQGWNVNGGWSVGNRKISNNLRVTWNDNKSNTTNTFAGITNVASSAGINGVSTNPLDWGVPTLSFANFTGLSGVTPARRNDQTFSISETVMMPRKKHNIRWGGDWRRLNTSVRSNSNANGGFTFTGFATAAQSGGQAIAGTGYDLADFLLGYAQQTTLQYSANTFHYLAYAYDAFIQDDWRVSSKLTLDLGLRYEYNGPYTETQGQLVNLDVAPGFTAVAPVQAGQAGPFNGTYPASLVKPDRNNFAPRIGIAYRLGDKTVLRAGYGVNYNLGQYRSIVQNLALQPPFSTTETNLATYANLLTLANGFPTNAAVVTNSYAVDPDYRLGYVQMWNLNVQRQLPAGLQLSIGYQGSKGTALDIVREPNRGPDGLLIPTVQPYLFESSQGFSILHSGSVRLRKQMRKGISVGGTYVYSKSIDDASSIGGGATVVAQNEQDLAAERGLSSFDQRHKLTGDYVIELPFGTGKKWLNNSGFTGKAFGDWTLTGDFTIASGIPFTARILGAVADVARGSNGSLRADYNGQAIQLGDRTLTQWFNTSAFTVPVSGTFGNAGRNTIIGPGTLQFDLGLTKNIPLKDMMALEISAQATNFLNHVNYTSIDTVVNSPTFGQVIGVGSMRKIQLSTRFRF